MASENSEIEKDDYLDDYDNEVCPFTKTRCYTPWLRGDCWNDCPRAHYGRGEDW